MGRATYACATCAEHFTRRYSAIRHNLTIHNGRGEIVPLLEYLVGRSSGRYQASHPSWYRGSENRVHKFGHATTADSMGETLRSRGLQQETLSRSIPTPLSLPSTSQPQPQGVSPYPTDRISEPIEKTNHQGTLSQETIIKIQELKRLLYRYPIFSNPDGIIKCVTHFSIKGDNTILDEKLEQLRSIDAINKY
ncbi:MAG: hypothetical protein WAM14_04195 [Candidatus Nitrosopolaris sp.]